jgi:hypothetical protein
MMHRMRMRAVRQRVARLWEPAHTFLAWALFAFALALLLARDTYVATDLADRVRGYVRDTEFDFVEWTLDALGHKLRAASVSESAYLVEAERARLVRRYFETVSQLEQVRGAIARQYADPAIPDPATATADLQAQAADLHAQAAELQPLAESILQEQIAVVYAEQGVLIFPPVSFHFTPLPYALIVSPRTVIRQDANLDVSGDLTLEQQAELEDRIAREQDVSTLIVPLGGIGTYPTMVAESSDLNWIASVTAHEWAHNYLTLRPLGINYFTSPELRTMNETTAEMVGSEIGALVVARYYLDLMPPAPPFRNSLLRDLPPEGENAAPAFDFNAEMHTTRVRTDALLAEGKVEEAEAYMEERRRFLWDHGYQIRKLNQAYFAFYGAYAAGPGGAPGADPVGPAVRLLRRRSPTLADFLKTMAGFSSYEQLRAHLGMPPSP